MSVHPLPQFEFFWPSLGKVLEMIVVKIPGLRVYVDSKILDQTSDLNLKTQGSNENGEV